MFTSRVARLVGGRRILLGMAEKLELFSRTLQSKGFDTPLAEQIRSVAQVLPRRDAVVFDVGANVGKWTQELLRGAGDAIAQVHCFEPVDVNLRAIRQLRDPRVTVHPFGAGSRSEERDFYTDFPGSGIASLFQRDTPDAPATAFAQKVTIRPLDEVIRELGLARIDLVKMDIEGAEFEALEGMLGSIEAGIVRAFTFEIGSVNITSRTYLADFYTFATRHGFRVFRLTAGGGLHELAHYRVSQECFATTNYLAARPSERH